ncbi:hypothetical protein Tco_1291870 [Tanacetum coccineum]
MVERGRDGKEGKGENEEKGEKRAGGAKGAGGGFWEQNYDIVLLCSSWFDLQSSKVYGVFGMKVWRYDELVVCEINGMNRLSQISTGNSKTQFLNEIDQLSREYYYADHMNAILGVHTTLDEFTDLQCDYVDQFVKCERLEKEISKSNTPLKSFEALQQYAIDLELALQQCQEHIKNDKAFIENQSKVFLKECDQYF